MSAPVADVLRLDGRGFAPYVDRCVEVYLEAMGKPTVLGESRRLVTRQHLVYPGFRARLRVDTDDRVLGFCYGHDGGPGQWWHDVVAAGLGPAADHWLADSFEVVELHVVPAAQGRGLGRLLLTDLLAGVPRSTVVLTAVDAETPARALYRSLGFRDLRTGFAFPSGPQPYAVMGRALPLDS